MPATGQHQIYDSTGTHFYFSGGFGALTLIVEGYSCGIFTVTSEIQQQAKFKLMMVTNGSTANYEAFINDVSIGTLARNPSFPPRTATAAKLGEYRNGIANADFKMSNWKTYRNGVLETSLPMNGSATDTTGNSTPVATNITFSTIAGYSPATPLTNARIGYQSLLTSSNITASAAVSGFPANNCLIDQTYEFYKPDVTDSTISG